MDRSGSTELAGLEPLVPGGRRWPALLGAALSVAMAAGLAHQLLGSGLAGLRRAVPDQPAFYLLFAVLYALPPLADYLIFRRLWGIPVAGLAALAKKRIANEVLFGYSGEAYFYAWARARARMVAAPFGAVKDVTILSAMAGNAATLAAVALALPFAWPLLTAGQARGLLASGAIVAAMSLPFILFSRRVFTLERSQLWWIFAVHMGRIVLGAALLALAWAAALPGVGLGTWLMLSAARLLVSRLPFLPNKDLLFANAAILLIGRDHALADLLAFTAALTLCAHAAAMAIFGVQALVKR